MSDEQTHPADLASLRSFALRILEEERLPAGTELAVYLVGDAEMSRYNEQFMDRRGTTDVLAFPLEMLRPGEPPRVLPGDPPIAIGDVFLCPAEIERRAKAEKIPFDDFLHLLLAHGILHLLGYEHDDDEAAEAMERREDELLALIGRSWS